MVTCDNDQLTRAITKVRDAYYHAQLHTDCIKWGAFYPEAWGWCMGMGAKYDRDPRVVADVVAALSPMKGWDENRRLAEKALKLVRGVKTIKGFNSRLRALPAMQSRCDAVARALDGQGVTGPKVTAFAANIKGDMSIVTVDRHMHALTGLSQVADASVAITAAAATVGRFPAEVQAITWGYHRHNKGYTTYE